MPKEGLERNISRNRNSMCILYKFSIYETKKNQRLKESIKERKGKQQLKRQFYMYYAKISNPAKQ